MSVRSRRFVLRVLVTFILTTLVALPVLAQAKPGKGKRFGGSMSRKTGTLTAIEVNASTVTLTLTGEAPITLSAKKVKVIDQRGGKHTPAAVATLAVGQKVIVKTVTKKNGEIRSAKVKITG